MASVELRDVTKVFQDASGDIVAIEDLDLMVQDGEFLVLVGPSGCGKSTTLRIIAGLERETKGDIELDGVRINDRKPKNRNIAMVFQNYALYPHMTVQENIGFGLKMTTDLPTDEIDERVRNASELLGIGELLDRRPEELSGGQQQRVALGRAIVREPEVFLMDEPLSNLDAKLRTEMRTELQQLQDDLGITTMYVTHDQTEAMTMGDRIVILREGRLQQVGTPLDCYYEPANRFVAGFIGSPSMNFFEVEKRVTDDDVTLEHDSFSYELADPGRKLRSAANDLTLGIRPEAITIADEPDDAVIKTEVDIVEPMGNVNYVYFSAGAGTYTVSLPGERLLSEGSVVPLRFPEEHVHLFDRSTGEAFKNCDFVPEPDDNYPFRPPGDSQTSGIGDTVGNGGINDT